MDESRLAEALDRIKVLEAKVAEQGARIASDLGSGGRTEGNIIRNINGISEKITETRSKMAELVREVKDSAQKADATNRREVETELDAIRKTIEAHDTALGTIDIDLRGDKTDVNPGLLFTSKKLSDWYQNQSAQARLVLGAGGLILGVAGYIFSNNIEGRISANAENIGKNADVISKQDVAIAEIKRDVEWIRDRLGKK